MSNRNFTSRTEALITPSVLKRRYLHGVNTKDDDGKELSNQTLSELINNAVGWLEEELDIPIRPLVFSEANENQEWHDYRNVDTYWNWNFIRLDVYPVLSVESVKVKFPTHQDLIEYPVSWFRVEEDTGILRLVPDSGSVPLVLTNTGVLLPHLALQRRLIPQMLQIEYTAGFELDKIPVLLNNIIGLRAAIDVLNIAGDLITGAGIASQSIGLDGLSQSIATTSSATNAGYGARIIQYESQLYGGSGGGFGGGGGKKPGLLQKAKDNYKGIRIDVI